jgi:predicted lysophospholipase L1 biosynthesis ABC-type transport system permease subunit
VAAIAGLPPALVDESDRQEGGLAAYPARYGWDWDLVIQAEASYGSFTLSLVRRRRGELALLKVLGMTRRQVRAVVAWQTTVALLIAVLVGGPLGIVGGRLAWHAFAGSLGVVPIVEVPVLALVLGLAALVLAGNLLAVLPASVAERTRPGVALRTE